MIRIDIVHSVNSEYRIERELLLTLHNKLFTTDIRNKNIRIHNEKDIYNNGEILVYRHTRDSNLPFLTTYSRTRCLIFQSKHDTEEELVRAHV